MPKFKGTSAHWTEFQGEWNVFLKLVATPHGEPKDEELLGVLKLCLDPANQAELQRRLEAPQGVSYREFWTWLRSRYEGGTQDALLNELKQLPLKMEGRLTLDDW